MLNMLGVNWFARVRASSNIGRSMNFPLLLEMKKKFEHKVGNLENRIKMIMKFEKEALAYVRAWCVSFLIAKICRSNFGAFTFTDGCIFCTCIKVQRKLNIKEYWRSVFTWNSTKKYSRYWVSMKEIIDPGPMILILIKMKALAWIIIFFKCYCNFLDSCWSKSM